VHSDPEVVDLGATPPERCHAYHRLVMEQVAPEELEDLRGHLQRQHAYGSERFRAIIEAQLARRVGPAKIGRPSKQTSPSKSAL